MVKEGEGLIFLDSSVLIEYFRKTRKENSFLFSLQSNDEFKGFLASVVVQLEIYRGSNSQQNAFWENLFEDFIVVPFGAKTCLQAVEISKELKQKNKMIPLADIMIAATALSLNIPLATVNEKHFATIDNLHIISPTSL